MQANTDKRLSGLKEKVPDIRKTLDMVRFLQTRQVRLDLFKNLPKRAQPIKAMLTFDVR